MGVARHAAVVCGDADPAPSVLKSSMEWADRRKSLTDTFGRDVGRMNRDRIKINWKFDRKTARRKFGYQKTT
jgi:hypothetical protein